MSWHSRRGIREGWPNGNTSSKKHAVNIQAGRSAAAPQRGGRCVKYSRQTDGHNALFVREPPTRKLLSSPAATIRVL